MYSLFSFIIVQLLNIRQEFDVIVVLVCPIFSYYINDSGQLLLYFMTVELSSHCIAMWTSSLCDKQTDGHTITIFGSIRYHIVGYYELSLTCSWRGGGKLAMTDDATIFTHIYKYIHYCAVAGALISGGISGSPIIVRRCGQGTGILRFVWADVR